MEALGRHLLSKLDDHFMLGVHAHHIMTINQVHGDHNERRTFIEPIMFYHNVFTCLQNSELLKCVQICEGIKIFITL
jgi:hypothetical protein